MASDPAIGIVFQLRLQLFCFLFKNQQSTNIFTSTVSMQKHMDVVVCLCLHLRVSLLAERYPLPEASHPTIALVNEEFN